VRDSEIDVARDSSIRVRDRDTLIHVKDRNV